jgi:hypothetical protein
MYINGKKIPVKTIPGMGGGGIKEGVNAIMTSLIYCKYISKCHNVPPCRTTTTTKDSGFTIPRVFFSAAYCQQKSESFYSNVNQNL